MLRWPGTRRIAHGVLRDAGGTGGPAGSARHRNRLDPVAGLNFATSAPYEHRRGQKLKGAAGDLHDTMTRDVTAYVTAGAKSFSVELNAGPLNGSQYGDCVVWNGEVFSTPTKK